MAEGVLLNSTYLPMEGGIAAGLIGHVHGFLGDRIGDFQLRRHVRRFADLRRSVSGAAGYVNILTSEKGLSCFGARLKVR
ncbi:hypothetical protein [Acididesulfobacillus acetoxydans]|uniref:hypothetical protein n=1 Tax=Acididesulfobacillus acetoxydans TaxID=1561005 RepID=UPI001F0E89D2|nr:hypothetical protein [Acididesulfobacillus acetoxydans]